MDQLCTEAEQYLRDNLAGHLRGLDPPKAILQGPTPDAATSAVVPVICITSPGMSQVPVRTANGSRYSTSWTLVVNVWVRNTTMTKTAKELRDYVASIRECLLAWGEGTWTDEGYAQDAGPSSSGTMGAGFVELTVPVADAVDLNDLPPGEPLPVTTNYVLTVSPKEE